MPNPSQNHCLLLVDDDPFQLKLISQQLLNAGVDLDRISTFTCGTKALAHLRGVNTEEALIILDLNMPDMDGVEFIRQLVDARYGGSLALVSGEHMRVLEAVDKLARAQNLNVLGHLHKPLQLDVLNALLVSWRVREQKPACVARTSYTPERLDQAIAGGELFNVYQPQVQIATGVPVGVESLVRWRHPEDGVVYPDQFIGVAEEHGLIDALTKGVLATALNQAKCWEDIGLALGMSVNISMDNLTSLGFPDFVLGEIARSGASASSLMLEVTESRLSRDSLMPLDILTRLGLKHIGLSIDDFGTGHSSLSQLRDIPFDELKIDRSFVHGAATNATLRSIFEASLSMATQLEMKVVAEGVEDWEDWEFLCQSKCDIAQGYFVAKPMAMENIPAWIAQWELRRAGLAPQ